MEGLSSIPEAKGEAEEFKEAKGGVNGGLGNVSRLHGNWKITLLKVKFRKKLRTCCPGREICNSGKKVFLRNSGGIEAVEIPTGSSGSRTMCRGLDKPWALAKTGGPGMVGSHGTLRA